MCVTIEKVADVYVSVIQGKERSENAMKPLRIRDIALWS